MVPVKIWLEIAKERLAGNFQALQGILNVASEGEQVSLLAVVKANAYGHGVDPCAAVLAQAGAEWLGVTDAQEGARIRAALIAAGIEASRQPKLLVLCGTGAPPDEAESIIRHALTPVVWAERQIERLAEAARTDMPLGLHLEIDSGMSRQGVPPGAALDRVLSLIESEQSLRLEGVLTHFASTEVAHSAQTAGQKASFEGAVAQVAASGLRPQWLHVGNSSYIDNDDGAHPFKWLRGVAASLGSRSMVRSGLGLYGYTLPVEGDGGSIAKVLPVLTWKTRVIGISEIAPGTLVGYGGTFQATRPMRLALLPVGYADGLRRELSASSGKPGGWVMIRGQRAAVVGRVSMNLTTVDVSAIPAVAEGDEVILLGDGITAADHARIAGTIPYEILCGLRTSM